MGICAGWQGARVARVEMSPHHTRQGSLGRMSCNWQRESTPAGSPRLPTRMIGRSRWTAAPPSGPEHKGLARFHDQTKVKHHDKTRCSLMEVNPKTKDPAGSEAGSILGSDV